MGIVEIVGVAVRVGTGVDVTVRHAESKIVPSTNNARAFTFTLARFLPPNLYRETDARVAFGATVTQDNLR